jgi:hypothetical protein
VEPEPLAVIHLSMLVVTAEPVPTHIHLGLLLPALELAGITLVVVAVTHIQAAKQPVLVELAAVEPHRFMVLPVLLELPILVAVAAVPDRTA